MIITKNQYLESRIHCVESRQNLRLLDSLTWGELVITSCVEDSRFFQREGKSLEDACAPQGRKGPAFSLSHVSLLTRSIKTYPINLRLPCTLWLLRQHSIQTRQISSSSSWSSFSFPPCKRGWGVGEEGRHWWRMNGIHQNRPFFKMAQRQNFLLFSG